MVWELRCSSLLVCWRKRGGGGLTWSEFHLEKTSGTRVLILKWNSLGQGTTRRYLSCFSFPIHPSPYLFSLCFLREFNLLGCSLGTLISYSFHPRHPHCVTAPSSLGIRRGHVCLSCLWPKLLAAVGRPCWCSEIKSESWINSSGFLSHLGLLLWCWWLVIKDLLVWKIKSSYTNINESRPLLS